MNVDLQAVRQSLSNVARYTYVYASLSIPEEVMNTQYLGCTSEVTPCYLLSGGKCGKNFSADLPAN
jgi:hypothetical protein